MSTTVATENGTKLGSPRQAEQLPTLSGPRLPYHPAVEERFGIDRAGWKALVEAIFPNASSPDSVVLALSYCRARKLDVFKRVVHIVAIWDKNRGCMVDSVWPGIGELRTTAFRTQEYAGREDTVLGPDVTMKVGTIELTFPEWAKVTVYRMVKGQKVAFSGPRVYWLETYANVKRGNDTPNEMWANRPRGQLEKCAEAAALRAAFPEEIGSDYIPEEVQGLGRASIVETVAVATSKTNDLADRLKPKAIASETFNDAPYNPDAMKATISESSETITEREPGDEPPEEQHRLSDLALAIEGALHEPKLTAAGNNAQAQQITDAASEKQLTPFEVSHLQKIVAENSERLAAKKK